ncbi:tetratricopeptide repeat protein [Actinomyces qiguomingii]|uniref:tetratricopeptide repeat protein n=1 Tax=Actinomyces qiguomingii TaxID=2057800 RepID=UPI000CA02DEA|nr:tetratricopeptide repeat protein [Actinomyces qiguomingii]
MTQPGYTAPDDPRVGSGAGLPGGDDAFRPGAHGEQEAADYAARVGISGATGADTESVHHRSARLARRRRLLTWHGIPAAVVAAAAVWLLVLVGITFAGNHAALGGDYAAAVSRYRAVARLNPWLEQWRVHYNLGTAQLMNDQLDAAVGELEEALGTAPAAQPIQVQDDEGNTVTILDPAAPECLVRKNLYVTHLSLAAVAAAAGDSGTSEAEIEAAVEAAGQCEVPPPPQSSEEPEPDPDASSSPSAEPTPSDGASSTPTPQPTSTGQSDQESTPSPSPSPTPTDSKRRELEDRNSDANATDGARIDGGDGRKW